MKQRGAGVGIWMVSHTTGAVQQCTAWVCGGQTKQWVCTVGVGCMAAAICGGSQTKQCVAGVGFIGLIPTAALIALPGGWQSVTQTVTPVLACCGARAASPMQSMPGVQPQKVARPCVHRKWVWCGCGGGALQSRPGVQPQKVARPCVHRKWVCGSRPGAP